MKVDVLPIGQYEENIYVVHQKGRVLIIDPGRYAKRVAGMIAKNEIVDGIILTHGHYDHTGAADDLADLYGCPVYMNREDQFMIDPSQPHYGFDGAVYHETEDLPAGNINVGGFSLTVYHTPGHSAGSVCVRCGTYLFTGDTLFAGTIGRTDLPSGDESKMAESLRFLKTLPPELKVMPGHGAESTIGRELRVNPFLVRL